MSAPDISPRYKNFDRPSVVALLNVLDVRGIGTFLDRDNLVAGLTWPQGLEQAPVPPSRRSVLVRIEGFCR